MKELSDKQRRHMKRLADLIRGKPSSLRGTHLSEEHKQRIRESKIAEKNPMWRGDSVLMEALHVWVKSRIPKPELCESCKISPPLDLANKGTYNRELKNWEYLCRRCHMLKDGRMKNLKQFN